jgi:AcrR family transcriptional regulator
VATYKAGEETKRNILVQSKRLFYHNGIKNTTYSQIAKSANVNMGLIVYHFKTLNKIAEMIYQQILRERHQTFLKKVEALSLENVDLASLAIVEYRVHTSCYLQFPKYQRFISEVLVDSTVWSDEELNHSIQLLCEKYGINLPETDYLLHKFLFLPYSSMVTNAINSELLNLNAKQICEYHTKIRLLGLGISQQEINRLLQEVDLISSRITLSVDENFHFS